MVRVGAVRESQKHALLLDILYVHNVPKHAAGGRGERQLTFYLKYFMSLFWCILFDLKEQFGHFSKNNYKRGQ